MDEVEAARIWKDFQQRHPLEDAKTGPAVTMVFDANWVTLTLRYVVRYDLRRATRHMLSGRILAAIDATDGAVRVAIAATEVIPGRPIDGPLPPAAPPVSPAGGGTPRQGN